MTLNINLYNTIGQQVKTIINKDQIQAGIYSQEININDLKAGLYYVRMDTGNGSKVEKIIVSD